MDPQSSDDSLVQLTVASIKEKVKMSQLTPRSGTCSICPFPNFLTGIDDRIRSPQLASFGPCHYGKEHLLPFEDHKYDLHSKFLSRTKHMQRGEQLYVEKLEKLKDKIKGCYSPKIAMPSSDVELLVMMLVDGSFMVELFLQYDEDTSSPPWPVQTLIADMLKLENQLPFFVLKELFTLSNVGQSAKARTLPDLALRYLSQAFCKSSETVVNFDVQDPKHLLDLFRRSLLPPESTNNVTHRSPPIHPIQSVKHLRSVGITMRQKVAKSLLEIDFRKFQIPPLALKIPPLAIDDFTNAILVNCVALEQCLPDQSKHFTAYVYFMSCLVKQPEDVGYLRSADIINGISQDETSFINILNSIGSNVHSTLRESYLWKQLREIHCYYNSYWASIRRTLLRYDNIMLYFSLLQIVVGILSWRLPGK